MPTLTGTYIRANGDPARGGVLLTPSVAITGPDDVMLSATQRIDLDADGSFEVDLPATDDPEWTPTGWVWQIEERIPGGRTWAFELTGDADISDLAPVDVPDSYLPWEISATATTGLPGTDADVEVTGTAPQLTFEFTVPRGDKGDTGDPGPTTDLSIGTVTTLPPGSQATADITGTPPTLTLDLGLPEGDQGDTGPANELSIGTVTTLSPGASATATITGTPPSQKLDLGIPQGAAGSPLSTIDAKGDLLVGTANDTVGRLPVGVAGTNPILTPDTSAPGGLAWKSHINAGVARAGITTSATSVTWSAATPVLTISDTATVTLPAASSNTGSVATIINIGTGTVTISRTSPDVIAGSLTSVSMPGRGTLRLVSDGVGWRVIDGSYTSSAVGLATYEWNHVAPGWRLIAYDSGWRDVSTLLNATHLTENPNAKGYLRRVGNVAEFRYDQGASGTTTGTRKVVYMIAAGFRAEWTTGVAAVFASVNSATGATVAESVYYSFSSVSLLTSSWTAVRHGLTGLWSCASALPTSLPGTEHSAPV